MKPWALIAAAGILATPFLWQQAERHREACIHDGRIHCSVLPWIEGKDRPAPKASSGIDWSQVKVP